jgi:hypothetical protein
MLSVCIWKVLGLIWARKQTVLTVFVVYCILASCYIRLTLTICSFVHQCNTFTSYFLLIVDMFRPHLKMAV